MNPRDFTGEIERYHKRWLANALWVPGNGHHGIDLLSKTEYDGDAEYSDGFAIEFKSKIIKPGYPKLFAVNADQVNDFPQETQEMEFYWAFMFYTFAKEVKDVKKGEDLETLVTEREVWCIPWDWIRQFPVHNPKHSGPFRYVPKHRLPPPNEMTIFEEEKGRIYVPKNSNLETHLINRVFILNSDSIREETP
ncbi:hypothetical protein EXS74_01840 [Candidatus Woesearchaeota archaeon]|nr:hypothetical protein [Candidatus Woesearchaeota archaeon]